MVTPPDANLDARPVLSRIVGDSAGVFAVGSVLLFTWGFAANSAQYFYRGVPSELIPKLPLHEYLMDGGAIALFFFVLPLLILDGLARAIERERGKRFGWRQFVQSMTLRHVIVVIVATWFVSTLLASWTSQSVVASSERPRVIGVRLASGQLVPHYRGLMLAAYVDGRYVLVDRFARDARVYVINADHVSEIQFQSWVPQQGSPSTTRR
jgi:hypothetical protein